MIHWRSIRWYAIALLFVLASVAIGGGFEVILTEQQLAKAEARWGQPARKRLTDWVSLIASSKQKPEQEKLKAANDIFNQLLFVSDMDHWGVEDYWATPFEMLGSGGGDCEDFAIGKYFTLLAMGGSH